MQHSSAQQYLPNTRTIHLIAICGSGMGAFAGLLKSKGFLVTGSDANVYPPMSIQLAELGIPVFEGYRAENLDHQPDLVVIGNHCRRDNPECVACMDRGLPYMSFPQALASLFLCNHHPVVMAGTHGKTTTTAWTTHVLHQAGWEPSALMGGIVSDFNGPFLLGDGPHFIVEGDEYDTAFFDKGPKFLHYRPQTAVLTNVEYDHVDIFGDLESYEEAFHRFVGLLPHSGTLAVCADDPPAMRIAKGTKADLIPYGFGTDALVRAIERMPSGGGMEFTLVLDGIEEEARFFSPMAGEHNVQNALAVIAVCRALGMELGVIRSGLATFPGVVKRQQEMGNVGGVLLIDDYAHHPTAVRETLKAIRLRYPGRRLWSIFEAKSNTSRRNVFQEQYAQAFRLADVVVVAQPYAKKDAIPEWERLDVTRLIRDIQEGTQTETHFIPEVDAIVELVADQASAGDVIVVMSGSGFGNIQHKLLGALNRVSGDSKP